MISKASENKKKKKKTFTLIAGKQVPIFRC